MVIDGSDFLNKNLDFDQLRDEYNALVDRYRGGEGFNFPEPEGKWMTQMMEPFYRDGKALRRSQIEELVEETFPMSFNYGEKLEPKLLKEKITGELLVGVGQP